MLHVLWKDGSNDPNLEKCCILYLIYADLTIQIGMSKTQK